MSKTVQNYLSLITSEHSDKPNFIAMIAAFVSPMVQVQALMQSMQALGGIFDLSTPPVGNQLDIIGQWVGASRYLEVPVTGVFFTWDDTSADGWDYGIWQSPQNDEALTVLPDDVYLTVILAKIAANNWDGTTEGAYAIWEILFPNYTLLIQDNENMSYAVGIQGTPLDSLTQALLTGGVIPLRPEGILISEYFVPIDTNAFFGWDIENTNIKGWDEGSWAVELAPT